MSPSEEPPFHISSLGAKRNQLTLQLEPINPRKSTTPSTVAVFNKWDKCNKSINKNGKRCSLGLPGCIRWAPDSSETASAVWGSKNKYRFPQNQDFSSPRGQLGWDSSRLTPAISKQGRSPRAGFTSRMKTDPLKEAP